MVELSACKECAQWKGCYGLEDANTSVQVGEFYYELRGWFFLDFEEV